MQKHLIIFFILMVSMVFTQGINNENDISNGGIRIVGGINYMTFGGDDAKDADELGYMPGITIGAEISSGFAVGFIYSQKGGTSDITEVITERNSGSDWSEIDTRTWKSDNEFNLNYLNIYFHKSIIMDRVGFFVGGEIGYFWSGELKSDWSYHRSYQYFDPYSPYSYEDSESGNDSETIDRKDWVDGEGNPIDYGLIGGIQYSINNKINVVGKYSFGLAQVFEDVDTFNRGFQLYFTYNLF